MLIVNKYWKRVEGNSPYILRDIIPESAYSIQENQEMTLG
jgi:hypothetical protein